MRRKMEGHVRREAIRIGLLAAVLALLLCWYAADGWTRRDVSTPEISPEEPAVAFLQTGEDADCIVIWQGDHAVMIDTGEAQDAGGALELLARYGITRLDWMILTHPDKDHIGGAAEIARSVPIGTVLEPAGAPESKRSALLHTQLRAQGIAVEAVTQTRQLSCGSFSLTVYPPLAASYKKENNYSLAVLLSVQDRYALFTGDAMKQRQQELLQIDWPAIDLLKVPYHGRYTKGEEELLQALAPRYAVVTAAEAEPEVGEALRQIGAEVFYTRQGTVVFQTDGSRFRVLEP